MHVKFLSIFVAAKYAKPSIGDSAIVLTVKEGVFLLLDILFIEFLKF